MPTTRERRTAPAIFEDRANRLDKAIRVFGQTDPGATPPAAVAYVLTKLRERFDAAIAAVKNPAGQLSLERIIAEETPERRGGEAES